jgi:hypothetical protein
VTSPALTELRRLRRLGFRPDPILGENGGLEVVYFMREWQGWREVVLVYSEIEARAYRIRAMIPLDDVVTVVHALLSLPSPPPRPAA